ncbi:MAG: DUF2842 domain-containing protein [Pseudomonadota bacterium]|uniref:DUF2842 domain-containing protein n=1 Tax=unclassified Phenylobacterium TaxID=2640670 RepID=UPI0006FE138F|nr:MULTISPECIES: DUF2842 domain-containing protein [unclassified Phenylobacterium]KRB44377.1 hypothetical protein ASE02_01625 [Phenylobacterium sp. Root700]MBT9472412.1 DUF2842 domain-containing protein [Phenylobacterium sp.]
MSARVRKFIGGIGIVVFLGAYAWALTTVGEHLPDRWWAQLAFYGIGGLAWGIPILPLISWMNRGRL